MPDGLGYFSGVARIFGNFFGADFTQTIRLIFCPTTDSSTGEEITVRAGGLFTCLAFGILISSPKAVDRCEHATVAALRTAIISSTNRLRISMSLISNRSG